MQILSDWQLFPKGLGGGVLCVGNFDGVHVGHAKMLETGREEARRRGLPFTIMTFEPHPFAILRPAVLRPPLTTIEQRRELLARFEPDVLLIVPPTKEFLSITAEVFLEEVVSGMFGAKLMVEGPTFNFGCEAQSPFAGEVEVDESYFGPKRVRGKPGRGASGKTIVFGVLKRDGHVYTQIIPNCRQKTLRKAILHKISLESVIHSDGWSGYDGLVDMGYQKHLRVNHEAAEFALRKNHVNGIESFWSFAKRRLTKFNGLPRHTFYLHLKETEFRFNHRRVNLYRVLLRELRKVPL